jgi:hypothetical protein
MFRGSAASFRRRFRLRFCRWTAAGLLAGAVSLAAQTPAPAVPTAPAPTPAPPATAPAVQAPPAVAPAPTPVAPAPPAPAAPAGAARLPAACTCPSEGGGTLEHALGIAQEIFIGEVENAQLVGLELKRYTILVSSSWKSDPMTLQAETAAGACGAKLELGESYLFYGTWKQDHSAVLVGACHRYVPIDPTTLAAADLARLGKAPYEHPLTPERRQALITGVEESKKARGCAAHVQDAPPYFLSTLRTSKFERQRLLDDMGNELGFFQGTWTPRKGKEGTFVEFVVDNHTSCLLHLRLEARAGGQPVHLSRAEEFVPAGEHFRVRFVVMPPAGSSGDVELKPSWELVVPGS